MARYGPRPRPAESRYWDRVVKGPDCWGWNGATTPRGYGILHLSDPRRNEMAHRLSWLIHNGEIPEGICVLHRCDNPPCSRPDHLFLGTRGDNNRDASRKGRNARGERHGFHRQPGSIQKDPTNGRFLVVTGKALHRSASRRRHGPTGGTE